MKREALIDGDYRYWLSRDWAKTEGVPYVLWVMLNPSTADGLADDPTVRKCIGFTKRLGFERLFIVNLFALRATDPGLLRTAQESGQDIVGPANDEYISKLAQLAPVIVCAWGAYEGVNVPARVVEVGSLLPVPVRLKTDPTHSFGFLIREADTEPNPDGPKALGYTKAGHPRHPLMMPYYAATQLKPWPRRAA